MGVPRPPIDLVVRDGNLSVLNAATGHDLTVSLSRVADAATAEGVTGGLDGALFKSRSPSCGIGDARHYQGVVGAEFEDGGGLLAGALRGALPALPMLDERQWAVPARRWIFCYRVQVHALSRREGLRSALSAIEPGLRDDPFRLDRLRLLARFGDRPAFLREAGRARVARHPDGWPAAWEIRSLAITPRTVRDLHNSRAVRKDTVSK